jgi:hypothetical protein
VERQNFDWEKIGERILFLLFLWRNLTEGRLLGFVYGFGVTSYIQCAYGRHSIPWKYSKWRTFRAVNTSHNRRQHFDDESYTAKNDQVVAILMKTGLNNALLPTLFTVVNNIEQYCYTRLRLNNIVQYYWQVWTMWAAKHCSILLSSRLGVFCRVVNHGVAAVLLSQPSVCLYSVMLHFVLLALQSLIVLIGFTGSLYIELGSRY